MLTTALLGPMCQSICCQSCTADIVNPTNIKTPRAWLESNIFTKKGSDALRVCHRTIQTSPPTIQIAICTQAATSPTPIYHPSTIVSLDDTLHHGDNLPFFLL